MVGLSLASVAFSGAAVDSAYWDQCLGQSRDARNAEFNSIGPMMRRDWLIGLLKVSKVVC